MNSVPSALTFLLMIFAGWVNRQQLIARKHDGAMPRQAHQYLGTL
jgi:hypothetical protein